MKEIICVRKVSKLVSSLFLLSFFFLFFFLTHSSIRIPGHVCVTYVSLANTSCTRTRAVAENNESKCYIVRNDWACKRSSVFFTRPRRSCRNKRQLTRAAVVLILCLHIARVCARLADLLLPLPRSVTLGEVARIKVMVIFAYIFFLFFLIQKW